MALWSRARVAWLSAGLGLSSTAVGACDSNEFSSNGADAGAGQGGASDGDAGAASDGGTPPVGAAGEGADASPGGQGGAASGCGEGPACDAGRFCRESACVSCADFSELSTLQYGTPEPLSVLNASIDVEGLRFARPIGAGTGLLYVRDFFGGQLWFTSDPSQSAGNLITTDANVFESGGLRIGFELPEPLSAYDFFFNRRSAENGAVTKLYGASMDDTGVLTGVVALPEPFNASANAAYSLALSEQRAIWTENIDGSLDIHLKTVRLPPNGATPTDLRLPLPFGCGFAKELEYSPWLTPDGRTLFFSARALDETCMPTGETPTRIYVIALSELGEPIGTARALTGLAEGERRQTDAALSLDSCQLYFSATTDEGVHLFRAERTR